MSYETPVWRYFALAIWLSIQSGHAEPISIVQQPADQEVLEGGGITLNVFATGSISSYEWYKNGSFNRFGQSVSFGSATLGHAGNYHVVIRGPENVVTSRVAKVTVIKDVWPPMLLSAQEHVFVTATNALAVTFNEDILRAGGPFGGTNVLNYNVKEYGTSNNLPVVQAQPGSGNQGVRLQLGERWREGGLYLVTVSNVADIRSNVMRRPMSVFVSFFHHTNVFSMSNVWAWNDSGSDLGTEWRERDYDDSAWPRDPAPFSVLPRINFPCFFPEVSATVLRPNPITYYFRAPFVVEDTSGKAILRWKEVVEEGAVFYLNGQEIRRANMPSGVITASTYADNGFSCTGQEITFNVTNLLQGTNMIAVELHKEQELNNDEKFALQLDASIQRKYPMGVPLQIAAGADGRLRVSWEELGVLETAPDPDGPWDFFATNSPTLLEPAEQQRFFRVQPVKPN